MLVSKLSHPAGKTYQPGIREMGTGRMDL